MATRFQLGTISTQAAPAGVVQAFAGATAPTGWLLCNGAAISRTTYAALFAAIASAHGSGDGSTTFNLPDYRGRILRGRDGGIARDPDRASRTAANSGGATGDNVGSVQGDQMQGHYHSGGAASTTSNQTGSTASYILRDNSGIGNASPLIASPSTDGSNGTPRTGSETRPINAYVNYIIKV